MWAFAASWMPCSDSMALCTTKGYRKDFSTRGSCIHRLCTSTSSPTCRRKSAPGIGNFMSATMNIYLNVLLRPKSSERARCPYVGIVVLFTACNGDERGLLRLAGDAGTTLTSSPVCPRPGNGCLSCDSSGRRPTGDFPPSRWHLSPSVLAWAFPDISHSGTHFRAVSTNLRWYQHSCRCCAACRGVLWLLLTCSAATVSARREISLQIYSKARDGEASASTLATAAVVMAMSQSASSAILKMSVSLEAVTFICTVAGSL